MSASSPPGYQWSVVTCSVDELSLRLNELEGAWEIFSVIPTIQFAGKMMGAAVPSGMQCQIVVRRPLA